jgi:hypothetical protein
MNFRPKIFRAMASISSLAFVSGWMRLIFRVSSIAGLCLGLSRRRSLVRARFSRVHLAHKWTPKRTPSGGFSFPPDDDEEFRGGRGKRVNRPPATKRHDLLRQTTICCADPARVRMTARSPSYRSALRSGKR